MSTNTLLSAIRGLEDAVYYRDCRGRYASLPDNNSMRIDLLSSRINDLAKMIEDSMGGDIPANINSIVKYLIGSNSITDFVREVGNNIIEPDVGDDKDYTTVQNVLQELYKQRAGNGETGVNYDADKDGYVKYMENGTVPENYTDDIARFPNIFDYIYRELNYLFEHLFQREDKLDVYEGMSVGFN